MLSSNLSPPLDLSDADIPSTPPDSTLRALQARVVGVMPKAFEFLCPWFQGQTYALWTPFPLQGGPGQLARDDRLRDSRWLLAVGRLKVGVSHWAAEADLRGIAARLAETYPRTNGRSTVWVDPFLVAALGSTVGKLLVMLVTVGFVLAVACANVASLVLAKGAGRLTEVAVRVAMGASRRRIVRQMHGMYLNERPRTVKTQDLGLSNEN